MAVPLEQVEDVQFMDAPIAAGDGRERGLSAHGCNSCLFTASEFNRWVERFDRFPEEEVQSIFMLQWCAARVASARIVCTTQALN